MKGIDMKSEEAIHKEINRLNELEDEYTQRMKENTQNERLWHNLAQLRTDVRSKRLTLQWVLLK
jgi:hypothetical protein